MIEFLSLIIIVFCMFGGALFSGMETGVISIHRMRLRHFVRQGAHGAKILQGFLDDSDRLLGTTLVGNNIFMVIASVFAASLMERLLGSWGEAVSTLVVSIMLLVFSEYLPKSWFRGRPLDRCLRFAGVLHAAEIVFRPFSRSIIWLTRSMVPGPSKSFSKPAPFVTVEDIKILARESEKDGILSSTERVMINRVFDLSDKTARQIMIPREKMVTVNSDATLEKFFKVIRKSKYTRLPVWDEATQQYIGIINVFYVLSVNHEDHGRLVRDFTRPPVFVPENMPVDDIFPRLRRSHQPMSLVTNDKSEVVGLITTEDILEEIVGKL